MEKNKAKGVVLLSGGMDSCVTAAIARERHGAGNVAALHAGYGQRTEKRELRAFTEIADFYGIRERLVVQLDHFRAIGASALTDERIAVPESSLGESDGRRRAAEERRLGAPSSIPVTYVPFRNAHFLSVAVSWAEAIGAEAVYIGAVAEDSSGYPDCRPEYYRGNATGDKNRDCNAGDCDEEERNYPARRGAGRAIAFDVVVLSERRCGLRRLR